MKEDDPLSPSWEVISTAPFDCDLELAVIEDGEVHSLVFPCRRTVFGWLHAETNALIEVYPTHWREWQVTD